ncbi:MAG: hypothetical protein HZB23_08885 [Deltaproteobacteria bacterium]|nr:hypothetical protein [Deltaproteobacteria bacterium]
MKMNFIRSVLVGLFMGAAAFFAIVPGGYCTEPCFDCLIRATDEAEGVNPSARSLAGDIIACRPEGWAWGRKETGPDYRIVRICGLDSQGAELLCVPLTGPDGLIAAPRRFSVDFTDPLISGGGEIDASTHAVIIDRSRALRVTATGAKDAALISMAEDAADFDLTGGGQ